jgi:hypothetical protein
MVPPRRPYQQRELRLHEIFPQHCSLRLPREAFVFHVPMGGKRSAVTGSLLKRMGAVAGFPDLAILLEGKLYCVELKSDRGRVSEAQKVCHERLRLAGATVGIANDIDGALGLLEAWGLLPELR